MNEATFRLVTDQIIQDARFFLPEIALTATICLVILLDLVLKQRDSRQLAWVALAGVVASGAILIGLEASHGPRALFRASLGGGAMSNNGMIIFDSFGNYFKLLILGGSAISIVLSYLHKPMIGVRTGEYYGIMLTAVLGCFLMCSASDMLMFVLSVEMVSIPSYILVCHNKQSRAGAEASLKYVIYGSVCSGMMLYGFSLLYGLTGTTQMASISHLVATSDQGTFQFVFVLIAFLVMSGFFYKMSAVPMHFWTPDIYEGAPTPVTAFLSVASKAAGFAIFIRFIYGFSAVPELVAAKFDWPTLIAVLSAVTMTVGNLFAMVQKNMKRLLAYSSIAHAGYLMMGCAALVTPSPDSYNGASAVAFYFAAYLFMNLGAFTIVILVSNMTGREDVDGYRGLGKRAPFLAVAMTLFLFSLIGMPPTGGFVGKFQLFMVAIEQGLFWLVLVATVNTAISVYYYARIIKAMFLEKVDDVSDMRLEPGALGTGLVAFQLAGVLVLGTVFGFAVNWTKSRKLHQPKPVVRSAAVEPGSTK